MLAGFGDGFDLRAIVNCHNTPQCEGGELIDEGFREPIEVAGE